MAHCGNGGGNRDCKKVDPRSIDTWAAGFRIAGFGSAAAVWVRFHSYVVYTGGRGNIQYILVSRRLGIFKRIFFSDAVKTGGPANPKPKLNDKGTKRMAAIRNTGYRNSESNGPDRDHNQRPNIIADARGPIPKA